MTTEVWIGAGGLIAAVAGFVIPHSLEAWNRRRDERRARRAATHEEVIRSIEVFLSGRSATDDKKQAFLDAYAMLFLWAPDAVVRPLNQYLDANAACPREGGHVPPEIVRGTLGRCLLEMRRDLGHRDSGLSEDDFRHVSF